MGLRSRSSRVRNAQVLNGLNSVDTDCLAFNYYRSKTVLYSNQLIANKPLQFVFLAMSASVATTSSRVAGRTLASVSVA